MKSSSASFFVYFGLIAIGLIGYTQILPNEILVVVALGLVILPLFDHADSAIPVARLAALIATLQWLVGATLQYGASTLTEFGRYQMYVPEEQYFQFALPATCFYAVALIASSGTPLEGHILRRRNTSNDFEVGLVLLVISTAAMFAMRAGLVAGSLAFLFNLVFQFRYVAALYFYFSGHRFRWPLIALSVSSLFLVAGDQAVFHDLIIWFAIYLFYFLCKKRRSAGEKVFWLGLSSVVVLGIQLAKGDYRAQVWSGENPSFVESIQRTVFEQGGITNEDLRKAAIVRLNQGWIISAVLRHVPDREPYANGETLATAVEAALLPRFLAPNKKKAGGQENFRRFTGLGIQQSTSMAISPLGEAYANFGANGGILLMAVWGFVFGRMIAYVRHLSVNYPSLVLWIPLFIYQAIKAETEFATVFNQLFKGAVVAFGTYYLIHHIYLKNARAVAGDDGEFEPVNTTSGSMADIQRH